MLTQSSNPSPNVNLNDIFISCKWQERGTSYLNYVDYMNLSSAASQEILCNAALHICRYMIDTDKEPQVDMNV